MQQAAADVLIALGSDRHTGLSGREAESRLEREGPNEVPEKTAHPVLGLARKFWGLSAWMLELIALLSFILGKHADLAVALALLLVNAILSFLQEPHQPNYVLYENIPLSSTGIWRRGSLPKLHGQSIKRDVRLWPKADMMVCAAHVGFRG